MPFSLLYAFFGLWVSWSAAVYVSSPGWDAVWSVLTVLIALGLTLWGFFLDWNRVRIPASHPSAVRSRIQAARVRGAKLVKRDGKVREE